ncbi:AbiH family protein [Citricoccus nitrophenolicus]|uniref:AbiH family protein n=1 Tax=Citricoccus nitrophenolicus TaxID=863575 RepID=UPI0031E5F01E
MAYEDFRARFGRARNQYNIMALVGNGFDIQALSGLGSLTDTRYESFYHFLKFRKFNPSNRILKQMESLRGSGAENWSDVENAIGQLHTVDRVSPDAIAADLKEVQREFANFLDQVATPDVLSRLGETAVAHELTIASFTEFLGDIGDADEYNRMKLPGRLNIGDVFNFKFVNFNYTALLDDFVYLDQDQYEPHPYESSDRNITFRPNPRGHTGSQESAEFRMVSYLVSDVVHPHGVQSTPRSLLFGVDEVNNRLARMLSKPYWAQNNLKYGDLFPATDLFIIFGCSLGDTDRWWWRAIVEGLRQNAEADLILYWRRGPNDADLTATSLREKLASAAGYTGDTGVLELLEQKARIVLYDDAMERVWLNTNSTTQPNWVMP